MDVIVTAKNCEPPDRLKDQAREQVHHAARIFDRLLGVEVEFSEEGNARIPDPARVAVTARTKGHHIRAEGAGPDHREAIDVAIGRFERQLRRYKSRQVDRSKKRSRPQPAPQVAGQLAPTDRIDGDGALAGVGEGPSDPGPAIVRRKAFPMKAMQPEEAAWQLELLGHDFYLFVNEGNGQCAVVYRRRDGQLGLIEGLETDPDADLEEVEATAQR